MLLSTAVASCALISALTVGAASNPKTQVIDTTSGRFAPHLTKEHPDVASFLDIPYAKNPIGDLRFSAPVQETSSSGKVIQATKLPAGCFQYILPPLAKSIVTNIDGANFQKGDFSNTTEDCLHLTVYTPKKSLDDKKNKKQLPVVFWIHGGGSSFGGINVPYQLAPSWVQRSQEHIVVEIQYRLNILGLPNAAGQASEKGYQGSNLAVLDQRMALEWVHDNIAAFGGNPGHIVVWGESGGGSMADNLLFAYPEDPIMKGVIVGSGSVLFGGQMSVPANDNSMFTKAAEALGCGNLAPDEELACMRKVPSADIKEFFQTPLGAGGPGDAGIVFGTIVDNKTGFNDYTERIAAGGSKFPSNVPMLIGTTTDEGHAVVPYDFPGSETAYAVPEVYQEAAQGFTLGQTCLTLQETAARARAGALTFEYLYGGNFTDVSPYPWLGAYHTSELPMVFGTFEAEKNSFEAKVSRQMQDVWLAFVKDPARGLQKRGWKAVSEKKWEVREWGVNGEIEKVVDGKKMVETCKKNGFEF